MTNPAYKPTHPNMEATRYWSTHHARRVQEVVERAGISLGMFSQIKRGHTYPSAVSAIALEEASKHYAETPDDFMRADKLLELEERVQRRKRELEAAA